MAYTEDKLPSGLDAKTTPVDADAVVIGDSADSDRARKVTWANVKATLKTYLDTIYQPAAAVLTNTTASFTTAQESKIAGIEAGADVTDATNVTAAGALMDSECTSLADVKALNQSVVSGASPTFGTANMTDATNKRFMTDAQESKLDGVESGADVTDATNVASAGAVMEGDTSTASMSFVVDEDNMASNSATKVPTQQSVKAYVDANAGGTPEGTAVKSTGETGAVKYLREDGDGTCSWQVPAGSGNVSKVGTPANNQVGVWTGDGTIEGDSALTFDTTTDTLTAGAINATGLTASELVATDGSKNLQSLAVATYPSLTELSYVKGVTSPIQTQIGAKAPVASPTFTGTVTLPTGLTGVVRADSGVVSIDTDVTDIVSAASDSAAGKVELASAAETTTGTDAGRAVTPDGLAGSTIFGRKSLSVQIYDGGTDVAIGDGKAYITIPEALNGMNLVRAQATVVTAGTTNATTVMIHNKTDSQDMLSGAISIASAGTVGTVGTVNATYDDVATNDVLRIDVDSVSTTAPKGMMVVLEFQLA